ncbi:MAG: 5-dehydro-4-deoxy-D-glucuronate isomerase [Spirochaetia bacterium]
MEIRHAVHPEHAKGFDTTKLRNEFLVPQLFSPGNKKLVYSHIDRIIVGGICPESNSIQLNDGKQIGADSFFERREAGIINIGGPGKVEIDGKSYALDSRDGLYIGSGVGSVSFSSDNQEQPAKFYLNSGPAHKSYPVKIVTLKDAKQVHLGSQEELNTRTIYQFIHPAVLESCQLCMGMTLLQPNNIWNTMPPHLHDRRMEVYLYFDIAEDGVVFHLMGEPGETRHIVVRNEQAVFSPSWSIHSGVGTRNYTFIWGMVGENQTFTDMDGVSMSDIQ